MSQYKDVKLKSFEDFKISSLYQVEKKLATKIVLYEQNEQKGGKVIQNSDKFNFFLLKISDSGFANLKALKVLFYKNICLISLYEDELKYVKELI